MCSDPCRTTAPPCGTGPCPPDRQNWGSSVETRLQRMASWTLGPVSPAYSRSPPQHNAAGDGDVGGKSLSQAGVWCLLPGQPPQPLPGPGGTDITKGRGRKWWRQPRHGVGGACGQEDHSINLNSLEAHCVQTCLGRLGASGGRGPSLLDSSLSPATRDRESGLGGGLRFPGSMHSSPR